MINKILVENFRNFKKQKFEFSKNITVILGSNATGKTNILEAIFLLATGKSFRAKIEEEMINYLQEIARVRGMVIVEEYGKRSGVNLEVVLTRGEITLGQSAERTSKVARKKLLINGLGKRLVDFAGTFKAVLFGPWDLELVTESPNRRRKFLDTVLSQTDREYRRASLSYDKGLRQRNKLLLRIREEGIPRSQLLFWDKLLIKNGDYISNKREEFIDFVNKQKSLRGNIFVLEYDRSVISQARLEEYAEEEVAAATTLVGPHRDDIIFKIQNSKLKIKKERELMRYGSRGEQRMGVLWLKLAELSYIEDISGEKPTLLLDDVFSELDHEHRDIVMNISQNQQTIITTADPHNIEKLKEVDILRLRD